MMSKRPKDGSSWWTIGMNGEIYRISYFKGVPTSDFMYLIGNLHKTKKIAENVKKRLIENKPFKV